MHINKRILATAVALSLAVLTGPTVYAQTQVPTQNYTTASDAGAPGQEGESASDGTEGYPAGMNAGANGGYGGSGAFPSAAGISGGNGGNGGDGGDGEDGYTLPDDLSSSTNSYQISGAGFFGSKGGDGADGGVGGTNEGFPGSTTELANGGEGGEGGEGEDGGNGLTLGVATLTITAGTFSGGDAGDGADGADGGYGEPGNIQDYPQPYTGTSTSGDVPATDGDADTAVPDGSGGNVGEGGKGGDGGNGLDATGSTVSIYGGIFSNGNGGSGGTGGAGGQASPRGGEDGINAPQGDEGQAGYGIHAVDSDITLYGQLSSSPPGDGSGVAPNGTLLTGSGTIYGTLENNAAATTITYDVIGTGGIVLEQAPLNSSASNYVVTDTSDNPDDSGSLRYIVNKADSNPGSIITFDPTAFATMQTIVLTNGELPVTTSMAIDGPGEGVTISGNNAGSVFGVSGGPVFFSNLTIEDGGSPTQALDGGGINNEFGTLTLTSCTVTDNNVSNPSDLDCGGGIYNYFGTITLNDCSITGNNASYRGGGVFNDGIATLNNCTVTSNSSEFTGGGIDNIIDFSYVEENGTFIAVYSQATLTATDCTINANMAITGEQGGGAGVDSNGTASLNGCVITDNNATAEEDSGGGVENSYDSDIGSGGIITLADCILSSNSTTNNGYGGGLASFGAETLTNCVFTENSAQYGGADYFDNLSRIGAAITNCTVTDNVANLNSNTGVTYGGGLLVQNGAPILANDIFFDDAPGEIYENMSSGASISAYNCDIDEVLGSSGDQVTDDGGNIDMPADFVNAPTNLMLQTGSPCIGTGLTQAQAPLGVIIPTTDITGMTRPSQPSIGAYDVSNLVPPATVSSITVGWGTTGTEPLNVGSSMLPTGRKTDVPWLGINSFTITLSAPETLSPADVTLSGVKGVIYGPVTISGSGQSYTITLAQPVNIGDIITLTIGNAGISSYTGTLPVLPGDMNDDGGVNSIDLSISRNMTLIPADRTVFGDVNGDGQETLADYTLVTHAIGNKLP